MMVLSNLYLSRDGKVYKDKWIYTQPKVKRDRLKNKVKKHKDLTKTTQTCQSKDQYVKI